MSDARIIEIGGKRYVVGMTWNSFSEEKKRRELVDLGPTGSDWAVIREVSDEVVQAGFCKQPENVKLPPKTAALAPLIASVRIQPWLGIFDLGDGLFWYIAVRDGHTILPDGDAIGDEEFVLKLRDDHAAYYGTDWNEIKGGIEKIEDLIDRAREKPSIVFSLHGGGVPPSVIAGALGVLAIIAAGGWYMHMKHVSDMEKQRHLAMLRARAAMMAKRGVKPAPPKISPLETKPMPDDWIASCLNAARGIPVSHGGWNLKSYECRDNSVAVKWVRSEGATVFDRPQGMLSQDGNSVDGLLQFKVMDSMGHDAGDKLGVEKEALIGLAQKIGENIVFSGGDEKPAAMTLPGQTPAPEEAAHEKSIGFTLKVSFAPDLIGFDGVPGARIDTLSFDGAAWTLSGKLYEQMPAFAGE